jgi:hypothetical protein
MSSGKRLAYKPTVLPNAGRKISPFVLFIKEILNRGLCSEGGRISTIFFAETTDQMRCREYCSSICWVSDWKGFYLLLLATWCLVNMFSEGRTGKTVEPGRLQLTCLWQVRSAYQPEQPRRKWNASQCFRSIRRPLEHHGRVRFCGVPEVA